MKISITDEGCSVHTVFFHFKEKGYAFPEHTHAHTPTCAYRNAANICVTLMNVLNSSVSGWKKCNIH